MSEAGTGECGSTDRIRGSPVESKSTESLSTIAAPAASVPGTAESGVDAMTSPGLMIAMWPSPGFVAYSSAKKNAPAKTAALALTSGLILHPPSFCKFAHDPLLLIRKFFRRFDFHFDNEVAYLRSLADSLPANPEPFS